MRFSNSDSPIKCKKPAIKAGPCVVDLFMRKTKYSIAI
jgi:hypothetical protein